MKRILIIGNSGSGKSWLAARLAEQLTIREVNLDPIVWQSGGFNQKRPQHEIDHAIQALAQEPSWVIEGYVPITCCMGCPSASCKHALIFTPLP